MKDKKKYRNFILISFLVLLFIFFLLKLPELVNEKNIETDKITSYESVNKPGKILEQTKFDIIAKSILFDLKEIKVENMMQINYLVKLIVSDKINNIENSLAQEIVSFYLNNETEIAQNLSKEFVEYKLAQFDEEKEWRWRNYLLYLIDGDEILILYNQTNILRSVYDSEIVALNSIEIKPYEKQIYYVNFKNNTIKTIEVNLITGESDDNISKYINSKDNNNVVSINSKFIESDKKYIFKILIWN